MNDIQSTATIRQRGQLTLPDEIREKIAWLSEGSAVIIATSYSKDEIRVTPYRESDNEKIDWGKIWDQIKLARSFKGERGNLAGFIAEDRYRH